MKRWVQIFFGILLILLVAEILLIAPSDLDKVSEDVPRISSDASQTENGQQLMKGVHLIESREGQKDWELWADSAIGTQGKGSWKLDAVKIAFFSDNGTVFHVEGKQGTIDVQTKDIQIIGNVVTTSSNGYEFRTEIVNYNSKDRKLNSPNPIVMLGPIVEHERTLHLSGEQMIADLADSSIHIEGKVKADKLVEPKRIVHIQSHKSEFNGKSHYARFYDNVILDVDTLRITGPEAKFDYAVGASIPKSLFVNGGVKASDKDKWAVSQELNVEFAENKFIFKGDPRVVQNTDELIGEEIILLDGGKRVKVNRARARMEETNKMELRN